jgi:hypothetical protein
VAAETAEAFNMEGREGSDITKREFMYIRAVGLFKAGKYTAARTVCNQILEVRNALGGDVSCIRWQWYA